MLTTSPRRSVAALLLGVGSALGCAGLWGGEPIPDYAGSQLFRPDGPPTGAVIVLHGSEGGSAPFSAWLAAELARRDIVAVSYCWFDCEGLPTAVHRVPLDRTLAFVEWFAEGPADGLPVVLYGASRGAEHAVLLASLVGDTKTIAAVGAHAASDTVVASFDPATGGPVDGDGGYDAAWTWHGEPLYGERAMPFGSGPAIALDAFPGPVFLSHGEDDPLWPASRSVALKDRRDRAGALETELHVWPGEGHVVMQPSNQAALLDALEAFVERQRD